MMCSAAYWLASGASAIVATPSADVGSIGVYLPVLDVTGYYDNLGVKVELLKSGDLKAPGFPGTSLSDAQRADLQAGVDAVYGMFTRHVKAHRRTGDEAMRGQSMMGEQAHAVGLVDSLGMLWDATKLARDLGSMRTKPA
jgi:protease-4